jgi:hypothetical protein
MLSWFASSFGIPIDSFQDITALTGALCGMTSGFGFCQHGVLFTVQWLCYLSLYKSGQTFYSFQWDILLLEVGFASIFYAKWFSSLPSSNAPAIATATAKEISSVEGESSSNSTSSSSSTKSTTMPNAEIQNTTSSIWPLRFIFFKLMLMSGVVKVQSLCPTWLHLTALEYHFATQCLPTPFAWLAHQTPFPLLRMGVATTLVIEIPFTLMIISPNVNIRTIGAYFQLLLQVFIVLTGEEYICMLIFYMHILLFLFDLKRVLSRFTFLSPHMQEITTFSIY